MAYSDPVTSKQLGYIMELASGAIPDYEDVEDLDLMVKPVYGCSVHDMNRGQASMLIDDLLFHLGEREAPLEGPSIFGPYVPQPQ